MEPFAKIFDSFMLLTVLSFMLDGVLNKPLSLKNYKQRVLAVISWYRNLSIKA